MIQEIPRERPSPWLSSSHSPSVFDKNATNICSRPCWTVFNPETHRAPPRLNWYLYRCLGFIGVGKPLPRSVEATNMAGITRDRAGRRGKWRNPGPQIRWVPTQYVHQPVQPVQFSLEILGLQGLSQAHGICQDTAAFGQQVLRHELHPLLLPQSGHTPENGRLNPIWFPTDHHGDEPNLKAHPTGQKQSLKPKHRRPARFGSNERTWMPSPGTPLRQGFPLTLRRWQMRTIEASQCSGGRKRFRF